MLLTDFTMHIRFMPAGGEDKHVTKRRMLMLSHFMLYYKFIKFDSCDDDESDEEEVVDVEPFHVLL